MESLDQNRDLSNTEKVKLHFQENKKFYVGFGLGVLVVLVVRKPVQIINTVAPVFHNDNSSNVLIGGTLSKIVRCNQTKEIWPTVTETAEAAGVSLPMMSKHLNGYPGYEDIKGATYSIIGVGN